MSVETQSLHRKAVPLPLHKGGRGANILRRGNGAKRRGFTSRRPSPLFSLYSRVFFQPFTRPQGGSHCRRAISPREARFHPSAGRISLLRAGGERLSLPPEGPNPQKVIRTFPGTPPGRCRGLPRRKEFAFFRRDFSCRKTRQNFVKKAQNLVKLKSQAEMITKTTRKKSSNMTNIALKIKYYITKSTKSQAQNLRK